MPEPDRLTVRDLAVELGCTEQDVRDLIREGELRTVACGIRPGLVPRHELDAYRRRLQHRGDPNARPGGALVRGWCLAPGRARTAYGLSRDFTLLCASRCTSDADNGTGSGTGTTAVMRAIMIALLAFVGAALAVSWWTPGRFFLRGSR